MTDFEYQYPFSSVFTENFNNKELIFSHCSELEEDRLVPCFFWGDIRHSFFGIQVFIGFGEDRAFAFCPHSRCQSLSPRPDYFGW